jgi:Spy/CpxP family protein refolding chaperone
MTRLLTTLLALASASAFAQHHQHSPRTQDVPSPYAEETSREIKALSAQEQRAWVEGQGAGLAKAAELNGHPGPMHVLEHADALGLSEAQREQSRSLMDRHKAEVRRLGAELVDAERELDTLFRTRRATPERVAALTGAIGTLQARIRASHLITHIEQTRVLRPEQVAAYDRVRGYAR